MPTDFTDIPIDAKTFRDKLAGGFGRVVLFLRENNAVPFREAILDSCLYHRAFDRQAESYRTDYLLDIIEATEEPKFYATHIRRALGTDGEEYSYGQLYELAARLAQNGDEETRRVMYARFARQAISQDTAGAEEIVQIDGLAGYLFVAAQWQRYPLPEEVQWEEAWLLEQLEKQIGPEQTRQGLERVSQGRPEMAGYFAEVKQKQIQSHRGRQEQKPPTPLTYDDLRTRIADPLHTARWPVWRRYARRLDEEVLTKLAQDLLAETDRVPLIKMLHLFRERAFPLAINRLLDFAQGHDEDLADAARWALGNRSDERIRALALQLWADETVAVSAVHLLQNNFMKGDYLLITQRLSQEIPADTFHRLGMAVHDLVKVNPVPEAKSVLEILYQQGQCTLCRCSTIELFASLGPLPVWIVAEGRYDADSETRSLISKAAGHERL